MEKVALNGLVIGLIKGELNNTELDSAVKAKLTAEVLPYIFSVSKKHDVANIVYDGLIRNGVDLDAELKAKFVKEQSIAVFRYERMQYELEDICSFFDQKGIEYFPLKGSVIKRYYPRPYMRTSCDIDILVKPKVVDKARKALVGEKGFKDGTKNMHDISMFSPVGVHLELHHNFTDDNKTWNKVLSEIWQEKLPFGEHTFGYEMTPEYLFAYLTAHIAKHFNHGGCGIRPIADIYLLLGALSFDEQKLNDILTRCGLEKFWQTVKALAYFWFGDGRATETLIKAQEYIISGGVYGNLENATKTASTQKSRFKFVMRRIFPSFSDICYAYKILEKAPFLYPFCVVARWFKIFIPSRRKKITSEIKMSNVSERERIEGKKFFDEIGL